MAIHVRCRHGPGFSIDVASRIFHTIAAKKNDGSLDVVNVRDVTIKRYSALGEEFTTTSILVTGFMLSSLLTYAFVVPSQDNVITVGSSAWADERPIIVSSVHSTIGIRVMTPASQ
jgi:hypothetical protein